jgi:ribokinase
MRLHVVGNVCVDTSFRLKRLPHAGETLNGTLTSEGVGGKGANQAVAASRAGADVWLWTAVGQDDAGSRLIALLGEDISTDRILRLSLPTDRSTIIVDAAGENIIVSAVPCAEAIDPVRDTDIETRWTRGDVLLMQGNLPLEATQRCLEHAKRAGLTTILNPSPLADGVEIALHSVDLIIANRHEAEALTRWADVDAAARHMLALGVGAVIITLGAAGCLLAEAGAAASLHLAAPKVEAVDTSGAGDCFAGVVAGLVSRGVPLPSAVLVAIQAAAFATCLPGTIAAFPSKAALQDLIHKSALENA